MTRILVPVDGSMESRQALTEAATIFDDPDLVIFHVLDPFDPGDVDDPDLTNEKFPQKREEAARELLESYEDQVAEHDVGVETGLAYGVPSRAILGAIDDFDVDHVVLGSRGRTGAGRVLLGSVAETVARRAPVSVTIVRPDR